MHHNNGKIHAAPNLGAGGGAEIMPLTGLTLILLHQQWTVQNGIDWVNVSITDNHQYHTKDRLAHQSDPHEQGARTPLTSL